MQRTIPRAFFVLFLGFGWPCVSPACSLFSGPPRPIQCAESVALNLAIDGEVLFPGDTRRGDAFERSLEAAAIRALGENRIAIDPEGRDLRIEIRAGSEGEILIALSSDGTEAAGAEPAKEAGERDKGVLRKELPAAAGEDPTALLAAALDLLGQAISSNWRNDCEPARTLSAEGRFAFEVPPVHPEARKRYLSALRAEGGLETSDSGSVGTLIELSPDGEEERRSAFPLVGEDRPERFLVSDDGLFVVAFDSRPTPAGSRGGGTRIYRADGGRVARLPLEDLLTPGDLEALRRNSWTSSCGGISGSLEASLDDGRDLLLLQLKDRSIPHEIAIDLATGRRITPRRDLLPQMRVTIGARPSAPGLEPTWEPPVYAENLDTGEASRAFANPDLAREPSRALFEHAVESPLPGYTEIAKRARLQGTVEVEVVVSESGRVSCARVSRLPLGLSRAAEAAALRWRFQPFARNGEPVRAVGRFSLHFGLTDPPDEP